MGNDPLYGGDGDDLFFLGRENSGIDVMSGGAGSDGLFLTDFFGAGVGVFHLNRLVLDASASIEALILDTRAADHVEGTAGDDLITLSAAVLAVHDGNTIQDGLVEFRLLTGNDTYVGGIGSDVVVTSDGNDSITLGAGDDALFVTDGNLTGDSYFGGVGYDILHLTGLGDVLHLSRLALGVASEFEDVHAGGQIDGTAGDDVWDLSGMGFGFRLGSGDTNHLMDGNDRVILAAGMHVDGGAGNDTLYGTVEREVLSGGTGADVLYGGG